MLPKRCPNGYYTLKTTASSASECIKCPAGYYCTCVYDPADPLSYCDNTGATVEPCPEGYYCPAGTQGDPTGNAAKEC
jgi:hypothetical protein